jgi:DNA polymerase III subunit delta
VAAKEKSGPFRVFWGDEDLLIDQALGRVRAQNNREVTLLDGEDLKGAEVVSVCETRSMSELRVVVVDNAQKLTATEPLAKFAKERNVEDPSLVLVTVFRGAKKPALASTLEAVGRGVEFSKPKPWKPELQLRNVKEQANLLDLKLGEGVPELFLKFLGYDLYAIVNELKKLAYLVKKGVTVEKPHVLSLIQHALPVEPYEVAEAAGNKNLKKALNLLGFAYRDGGDVSIPVVYALMRLVERLLVVRHMTDHGSSTNEIAGYLSMNEYAFKMNLQPLAQKHTVAQLKTQMRNLCRLDTLVKGPSRSKRTEVELAVKALAT